MVESLENLVEYAFSLPDDWLICDTERSHQFSQLIEKFYLELTQFSYRQTPAKIILAEREPVKFLAGFIAACAANSSIFICNPNWVKQEWKQVFELVQPDIIWAEDTPPTPPTSPTSPLSPKGAPSPPTLPTPPTPHIMIPTGGSSGKIKFAIHTWETLTASVRGFTEYFQLHQVNSFCVLPLYHVSGLMQFMRCFLTGGKMAILPFKKVESGHIPDINTSDFFISLVPTQLQRLLQNDNLTTWLSQFQTVLLGGAPAWNELLEKARYYQIRVSPTYGMTETASQIATLKPNDFLNGKVNCGQILPHAKIIIRNEQGEVLDSNQIGNIIIQAESVALGYYPSSIAFGNTKAENQNHNFSSVVYRPQSLIPIFQTDDLGFLDDKGYLNIVGRNSDKIITGGENVYPLEIESAIRTTEMVIDVCVLGIPHQNWGQALTAIYIPKNSNTLSLEIQNLLKDKLSKFKIPKYWIPVQTIPRNSQGKINRLQLQQLATEYLSNHFS